LRATAKQLAVGVRCGVRRTFANYTAL